MCGGINDFGWAKKGFAIPTPKICGEESPKKKQIKQSIKVPRVDTIWSAHTHAHKVGFVLVRGLGQDWPKWEEGQTRFTIEINLMYLLSRSGSWEELGQSGTFPKLSGKIEANGDADSFFFHFQADHPSFLG